MQSDLLNLHEEFRRWRLRVPLQVVEQPLVLLQAMAPLDFEVEIVSDLAAFTRDSSAAGPLSVEESLAGRWFDAKALFYIDSHNFGFAAPLGSVAVVELEAQELEDQRLVIALQGKEVLARRLLRSRDDRRMVALAAETPDPRKSPPTRFVSLASLQLQLVVGILFDKQVPRQKASSEAVQIYEAPCLRRLEVAFRVRDESALPLALPGQIILGGRSLSPTELAARKGDLVAVALDDDISVLKRVSFTLPGDLSHVLQLESIGGLGDSLLVAIESVEGRNNDFPQVVSARLVLGVLYRG